MASLKSIKLKGYRSVSLHIHTPPTIVPRPKSSCWTMAPTIKVGDTIPKGTFQYIPHSPETEALAACGIRKYDQISQRGCKINICCWTIAIALSTDEWKGKKVVLVSVPGAFTVRLHLWRADNCCTWISCITTHWYQPTCHVNHLPPYLEKFDAFKAKGVDVIAVLAANDAFVLSGWAKSIGLKDKVCFTPYLYMMVYNDWFFPMFRPLHHI